MYILGINAYHGDASAAIIKDGRLIAAAEEERFNRIKHCAGFPEQSIRYCLNEAGVRLEDVDHIGISREPSAPPGRPWPPRRRLPPRRRPAGSGGRRLSNSEVVTCGVP